MLVNEDTIPQVAMEFMNTTHAEDVVIINELFDLVLQYENDSNEKNRELVNQKYQEWFKHTIEHFSVEEEKMKSLAFPPYPMHKGEHDKALHQMDIIFREWQSSVNIKALKNYLQNELPVWLVHHIQTMDTVTAMFFKTGLSPCSTYS